MNVETSGVDLHSHYWPSGMTDAFRAGRTWHDWRLDSNSDGTETTQCSLGSVPLTPSKTENDWASRLN